jgi:hypothetical protein
MVIIQPNFLEQRMLDAHGVGVHFVLSFVPAESATLGIVDKSEFVCQE